MLYNQYLLRFWGQVQNCGCLAKHLKTGRNNFWFGTKAARDAFKKEITAVAESHNCTMALAEYEGPDVDKCTVAVMDFVLPDGRVVRYEQDFGYGYPVESAHYMFNQGNYDCDCNRSLFIRSVRGNDFIGELDCGDDIAVTNFRVELRPDEGEAEVMTVMINPTQSVGEDRLETYNSMLKALEENRVLKIFKPGDHFVLQECCDEYFCLNLSNNQLRRLGYELVDLADRHDPVVEVEAKPIKPPAEPPVESACKYRGALVTYAYSERPDNHSDGYVSFCQDTAISEEDPDSFGVPDVEILYYSSQEELEKTVSGDKFLTDEILIYSYELVPV